MGVPEVVYDKFAPGGLRIDQNGQVTDALGNLLPYAGDEEGNLLDPCAAPDDPLVPKNAAGQPIIDDAVRTQRADAATVDPSDTLVSDLDGYLADWTDVQAIQTLAARDTRTTAAAHYQARLDAIGVAREEARGVVVLASPPSGVVTLD